jgi:Ca2+-binding EF-hand superfamily protein
MPVVDSMEAAERSTTIAKTMIDGNRRLSRTSAAGWSVSHVETILIEKVQQRTRCDSDRMKKIYGIFNDGFQDADDPGHAGIDQEEFANGLRGPLGIKVPISTCNALFRKIDNDQSGAISLRELNSYLFMKVRRPRATNPDASSVCAIKKLTSILVENDMKPHDLFAELDINGDDAINAEELKEGLHRYGIMLDDFEVNEIIAAFDTDGSGDVDEKEWQAGITFKPKRRNYGTDTGLAPVKASKRALQFSQASPTNGCLANGRWSTREVEAALRTKLMEKTRHDEDKMRMMYFYFNEDGSSGISPEEFAYGLRVKMNISVPDETCFQLFREIDKDGGGIIELSELNQYLKSREKEEGMHKEVKRTRNPKSGLAVNHARANATSTTFSSFGSNSFSLSTPPGEVVRKKRFAWN